MSRSISIFGSAFLVATVAQSAEAMPMNGTFTMHYDKVSPQPLAPDHMKIQESGTGINKSPGQPLDNAQVSITETVTLVHGQGPTKGTIAFTTPSGMTTRPYTGKVTTDAQGGITAVGTFKVSHVTGVFAGLKGSGSFTTVFSSQSDQETQWRGDFKPPKSMTSSR
jgi:hypothetical protein